MFYWGGGKQTPHKVDMFQGGHSALQVSTNAFLNEHLKSSKIYSSMYVIIFFIVCNNILQCMQVPAVVPTHPFHFISTMNHTEALRKKTDVSLSLKDCLFFFISFNGAIF